MQARRSTVLALCIAITLVQAQQLPMEPVHDSGQSIAGAYEGWFPNQDGTYSLLVGYFNRNVKEELDIPIGPNNRIDPGGPDQGQPTHFLPRRQWGMFTVAVPKDFGSQKITWTIIAHGKTTSGIFLGERRSALQAHIFHFCAGQVVHEQNRLTIADAGVARFNCVIGMSVRENQVRPAVIVVIKKA